jgi:hypothetical protein
LLTGICSDYKWRYHNFNLVNNKRKIIEGCLAFADVYDGYLEELFIRRKNDDNYYEKLCLYHTGVRKNFT